MSELIEDAPPGRCGCGQLDDGEQCPSALGRLLCDDSPTPADPPRACGCEDPPGVVCEHERDEYVIEDGSRTMRPVTADDYGPTR